MSQNPHFDFRGIHSSPDGDEVVQPPRRPKPETERRLLQGGPAGWDFVSFLPCIRELLSSVRSSTVLLDLKLDPQI